jgi:hypothetical protein
MDGPPCVRHQAGILLVVRVLRVKLDDHLDRRNTVKADGGIALDHKCGRTVPNCILAGY